MTKTTQKHFEIFKIECQIWEKRFGLDGWSILYLHEECGKNTLARTNIDLISRTVCVKLNIDWGDEPLTQQAIKDSAKHEMIHILIGRLAINGYHRFINKDELYESEEELVYKLEKIIR